MSTVESCIRQGIKKAGLGFEGFAEFTGVSPSTLHRHMNGQCTNSYTEKDALIGMVKTGTVDATVLPAYCRERCQIHAAIMLYLPNGEARVIKPKASRLTFGMFLKRFLGKVKSRSAKRLPKMGM